MPTELIEELRQFHRYLTDKLKVDGIDLSPEEALDEWRRLHPDAQASDEDVAAIQEALTDYGLPFLAELDSLEKMRRSISKQRLATLYAHKDLRELLGICLRADEKP